MFARNAEPIANVGPYKRVDLNAPRPGDPAPDQTGIKSTWQICQELTIRHEQDRIWELVKQTASGTNAPEYVAPDGDAA